MIGGAFFLVEKKQSEILTFGKISSETQLQFNKDTIFPISSLTKAFTSTLMGQKVSDLFIRSFIDSKKTKRKFVNEKLINIFPNIWTQKAPPFINKNVVSKEYLGTFFNPIIGKTSFKLNQKDDGIKIKNGKGLPKIYRVYGSLY